MKRIFLLDVFTMRRIAIATYVLVCCFPSSQAWAQNCKPDVSREDKISKQRSEIWTQSLYETGLLTAALVSTSEVEITATVGTYGSVHAINVVLQKREESLARAEFESAYRAVKGNQFFFGLKNGEPLTFVATEVGNETKASMMGKLITTVVLSAHVQDRDLALLREALTTKQIDAVRVVLVGDVRIEKSINDKNGKKMMEKFSCFYQSLDKRGIDLSIVAGPKSQPVQPASPSDGSVPRKYVRKGKSSDYLELSPDGTFSLQQNGKGYGGNYRVQGDTLTLTSPPSKHELKVRLTGNSMVDPDGEVWEKQGEPQKAVAAQLTIDQVIQMVTAKLPDDIIITTIQKSSSKFDLTPEVLIKLKTAGVSDAVIRAMTR